ncbi:MAG: hypothetical protein AAF663_09590 [Planctomycetota bacterium]
MHSPRELSVDGYRQVNAIVDAFRRQLKSLAVQTPAASATLVDSSDVLIAAEQVCRSNWLHGLSTDGETGKKNAA